MLHHPLLGLIALVAGLGIYFLPTIVAAARGGRVVLTAVINLFLGFTLIGWVVAMVVAVSGPSTGPLWRDGSGWRPTS